MICTTPRQPKKSKLLSLLQCQNQLIKRTETGCGKTTQIPQFILENFPKTAKIIVAQPRRLAATGVGEYIYDKSVKAGLCSC